MICKEESEKKPGFVYFLEYEGQGVKIGYTRNLTSRIKQLQIASPFKLNLRFYIETSEPELVEHSLHEQYKDKCLNGEWFDITKEDIKELYEVIRCELRRGEGKWLKSLGLSLKQICSITTKLN